MTPSKELFELIKSMSQSEKTYFKKYSRLHTIGNQNHYLLLFDAISGQRNYDEKKIIKKLKKYDFVRHFAVAKNYLYSRIMDSLESYHKNMSVSSRARKYIQRIEVLINKRLYGQALKITEKAKKICTKYELFEEMFDLIKWEYKIAIAKVDIAMKKKILDEANELTRLYNNYRIYRELENRIASKYELQGIARTSAELSELKVLANSSQLKNEANAKSIRSKFDFYNCRGFLALSKGDYEQIYDDGKNAIELFDKNPHLVAVRARAYIGAFGNLMIALTGLNRYDNMYDYMKKFNEERKKFILPSDKIFAFSQLYNLLNYYILTGKFNEAKEDLKRIEQEMKENEISMTEGNKIVFYTIFSQIYFGQENYKQCLSWLNKIILFGENNKRTDIESFVRIFSLVVYYEMNSDKDFMLSKFKSVYRFLYKHQRMYQFESIMMQFIRGNMLSKPSKRNIKEQFIKLKLKLEKLYKDPFERQALTLEYFDFIPWLESKIENKSFADVVREKAKKLNQSLPD